MQAIYEAAREHKCVNISYNLFFPCIRRLPCQRKPRADWKKVLANLWSRQRITKNHQKDPRWSWAGSQIGTSDNKFKFMVNGIKPLEPPDSLCLKAAEGWFELGNLKESVEEFGKIELEFRYHPDVLDFQTKFFLKVKNWETCIEVSTALIQLETKSPTPYIRRSFALHELKRTQEAFDQLLTAASMFSSWLVNYNLACYCAQLGKLDDAQKWYKIALGINEGAVTKIASTDPDLKPFWESPASDFLMQTKTSLLANKSSINIKEAGVVMPNRQRF